MRGLSFKKETFMKTTRFTVAMCLLATSVSSLAFAQDDDVVLEDDRGNRVTTRTTTSTSTTTRIPGTSDHDFVVNKLGVGYMGMLAVPVFNLTSGEFGAPILAPTIGARYWFDSDLALEAGLGINITGQNNKTNADADDTSSETVTGIAFRVGLPISLYASEHYSFQIIPDFRFAYGKNTGTIYNAPDVPDTVISTSTTTWGVGATAGAEIYFGFMNIPELSVQAGVGFDFSHSSASVDLEPDEPPVEVPSATFHQFRTTLDGAPWDIFRGSVRALYYF